MVRTIMGLCLLFLTVEVSAEPIAIFGINVSMSQEQQISVLNSRGYLCEINEYNSDWFTCTHYEFENRNIALKGKEGVNSYCNVFETCGFDIKEVAQNFVNGGYVQTMNYKVESNSFTNKLVTSYCGKGNDGDEICVRDGGVVMLNRGTYGKTFNFE